MTKWQLHYYNAKVAASVEAWPVAIRKHYLRTVELMVEHGPNLGLPHTKGLGAGLFEIRAKGREGIGRAFYCTQANQRIVILHTMVKKTQKTPLSDLAIARARLEEVKHEY